MSKWALLIAVAAVFTATAGGDGGGTVTSFADDDAFAASGVRGASASEQPVARRASTVTYEYMRKAPGYCGNLTQDRTRSAEPCVDGAEDAPELRECEDGSIELAPLFRRALDAVTGEVVEGWRQVDNGGCPEDPPVEVVLSVEEFRRLPIEPATPVIQPFDGRALVHLGVAVHTDGAPQELATTVVGVPVLVRATPVQFTWDFGDGTRPVVTTAAGDEWPDHAALGEYPEPGTFQLRLTTTWRGEFQVNGTGPWLPVTGTATTTSEPITISVETAPTRLYDDP